MYPKRRTFERQEECILVDRLRNADQKAREELLWFVSPLIERHARKLSNGDTHLEADLIQDALMFVWKYLPSFRRGFGTRVTTYFSTSIFVRMDKLRFMYTQSNIRSRGHADQVIKYKTAIRLSGIHGDPVPSNARLAHLLGVTTDHLAQIRQTALPMLREPSLKHVEGNTTYTDPLYATQHTECSHEIHRAMNASLSCAEETIIRERYLSNRKPTTYEKLGSRFGCSKEWARLNEQRALKKLRTSAYGPSLRILYNLS